ncbi:MAG: hypothetical protein GY809_10355 [Planctomycetes bacterium]|nr:hypothetical protein [Planctomycetota bacterium]
MAKIYKDGVFSQESHYEKGDLAKMVVLEERDGKPLKTEYPNIQVDGKSVKHGIAKRYLDDKLTEETEYQNGGKAE